MKRSTILLVSPKTPFNVGAAIRAGAIFGAESVSWTGPRIKRAMSAYRSARGRSRLPREERFKDFQRVQADPCPNEDPASICALAGALGIVPVAVEIRENAESLIDFVHPDDALYVFGPEDGSIPKAVLAECHRFVRIPSETRTPLNLAAAVYVVLWDRYFKSETGTFQESAWTEVLA